MNTRQQDQEAKDRLERAVRFFTFERQRAEEKLREATIQEAKAKEKLREHLKDAEARETKRMKERQTKTTTEETT